MWPAGPLHAPSSRARCLPDMLCLHALARYVDLVGPCTITGVVLYNRQDYAPERLTYFEVLVSLDKMRWQPCASYDTPVAPVYNLSCSSPLVARYVMVHLRPGFTGLRFFGDAQNALTLCEAQVMGYNS